MFRTCVLSSVLIASVFFVAPDPAEACRHCRGGWSSFRGCRYRGFYGAAYGPAYGPMMGGCYSAYPAPYALGMGPGPGAPPLITREPDLPPLGPGPELMGHAGRIVRLSADELSLDENFKKVVVHLSSETKIIINGKPANRNDLKVWYKIELECYRDGLKLYATGINVTSTNT